jgi:hypothetical protein
LRDGFSRDGEVHPSFILIDGRTFGLDRYWIANWKVNVVVELAEGPKGIFNFPLLVIPKHEAKPDDAIS